MIIPMSSLSLDHKADRGMREGGGRDGGREGVLLYTNLFRDTVMSICSNFFVHKHRYVHIYKSLSA